MTSNLARFILFSKWIRTSDRSIRPDAFIPHPWPNLSVTRHIDLSEADLWQIGQAVADLRPANLLGRADFQAGLAHTQKLRAEADPIVGNPNHAIVSGWPPDKPTQKKNCPRNNCRRAVCPDASRITGKCNVLCLISVHPLLYVDPSLPIPRIEPPRSPRTVLDQQLDIALDSPRPRQHPAHCLKLLLGQRPIRSLL